MDFIHRFRFRFLVLFLILCIFIFIVILTIKRYAVRGSDISTLPSLTIYGILITGKDPARSAMARHAAGQFLVQTHPHKRLLIVNHGSESVMNKLPLDRTSTKDTLYELRVKKESHGLTLGDLRNMALNLVPFRSDVAWITWDDDDWRAPNYLELLHTAMQKHQADVVGYARRHECNVSSNLEWVTELKTGFVHCLVRNDPRIRYQSRETMEDTHLYDLFKELKKKVHVIPPSQLPLDRVYYIRTVHGTNTSMYVQTDKKNLISNPESATWRELSLDALPDVRLRIRKICQSIVNPDP